MSTPREPRAPRPDGTKERARLIQLIHVGRREVQMSDDAWREYLKRAFVVESSTQLSLPQLKTALAHLRRIGFRPADREEHEWTFVDTAAPGRQPLLRKIIKLMQQTGVERGRQVPYVEGIAKQMAGAGARMNVHKPLPMCDEYELRWIVVALVSTSSAGKFRPMPVPTSPLTPEDLAGAPLENLPESLRQLIELVGVAAALSLVSAFAGNVIQIPLRSRPGGMMRERLVHLMGEPLAERLIQSYAGERMPIPRCVQALRDARDREIIGAYDAGASVVTLTARYALTERQIRTILKRSPRQTIDGLAPAGPHRQPSLF